MIGMTNKEKYINSFSGVEPSDEVKERILSMTKLKKRCSFKALSVAVAVFVMLAMAMLTVNAATDGAVGEKINEVSKEISEKITILFNGEEIEADCKTTVITDENGDKGVISTIILPGASDSSDDEKSESDDEIVFKYDKVLQDACANTIQESEETTVAFEIKVESETDALQNSSEEKQQ